MGSFHLVLWAVVPPLLLLVYYYRRVPAAPPLLTLLLFFVVGAVSGFVALGLEWGFEHVANWVVDWERITRSLPGVALRQLVEVGPIEEGSKLSGVILFQSLIGICTQPPPSTQVCYHIRWKRTRPSTVFLFTTAIALGFTAEENWVYLSNGTALISDRLIGTPVHALFSAPWGYALGVAHSGRYKRVVARAFVNAIACHALVNVLSSAWRYPEPLNFLSYSLFPFLLWMFWRMEGLLRRSQRKPPIILISGYTHIHHYWQLGLALFALMLGGNAIFGFFLLTRSLSPLSPYQLFYPDVWWFIVSRFVLTLIPGLLAWGIYRYLLHSASRRYR